ncbi:hypothetical protein HN011_008387 [Eciton burchellii]|nr:hypothetical protein HN011_008387 [Eciton burchellii]
MRILIAASMRVIHIGRAFRAPNSPNCILTSRLPALRLPALLFFSALLASQPACTPVAVKRINEVVSTGVSFSSVSAISNANGHQSAQISLNYACGVSQCLPTSTPRLDANLRCAVSWAARYRNGQS